MRSKLGQRLALACLLALAACSGDDDQPAPADAGAKDAGDAPAAGSGGKGTGSGKDKEGVECESNADCASGLSCLEADGQVTALKVCARSCKSGSDCEDNESCLTLTKDPADSLCWNTAGEAFAPCGPAHTALCDEDKNLGCLRIEDKDLSIAAGVCLSPCKLGEDNACSDGLACLDIIDDDDAGLCTKTIERGELCDEPQGKFCEPGNLCLDDGSEWRCYQDCSGSSSSCDDDKECKELEQGDGAYCD